MPRAFAASRGRRARGVTFAFLDSVNILVLSGPDIMQAVSCSSFTLLSLSRSCPCNRTPQQPRSVALRSSRLLCRTKHSLQLPKRKGFQVVTSVANHARIIARSVLVVLSKYVCPTCGQRRKTERAERITSKIFRPTFAGLLARQPEQVFHVAPAVKKLGFTRLSISYLAPTGGTLVLFTPSLQPLANRACFQCRMTLCNIPGGKPCIIGKGPSTLSWCISQSFGRRGSGVVVSDIGSGSSHIPEQPQCNVRPAVIQIRKNRGCSSVGIQFFEPCDEAGSPFESLSGRIFQLGATESCSSLTRARWPEVDVNLFQLLGRQFRASGQNVRQELRRHRSPGPALVRSSPIAGRRILTASRRRAE